MEVHTGKKKVRAKGWANNVRVANYAPPHAPRANLAKRRGAVYVFNTARAQGRRKSLGRGGDNESEEDEGKGGDTG